MNKSGEIRYDATSTCQAVEGFLDVNRRSQLPLFYIVTAVIACSINLASCVVALCANAVVIIAVWRTATLHQPKNVLLCSLAFSDLCVGLSSQPLFLVAEISLIQGHMELYCAAVFGVFYTGWLFGGTSFLTLAAVSLERYLMLRFHLRYAEVLTINRVFATIITYWSIWVTCTTIFWFWTRDKLIGYILVTCCVLITFGIGWCYFQVFKTVRRHNFQIFSAQLRFHCQDSSATLPNVTRFKRTTITMVVLIGAFGLCYIPFLITFIVGTIQKEEDLKTSAAHSIANVLLFMNSSLNPLIYFWRIGELREATKHTLTKLNPFRKLETEAVIHK